DEDYSDKVALEFFAKSDLEVKIAILPNKFKDPDQAIREDPKFFEEAVYNAIPPLDFFFGRYFKGKDLNDIHQKKKVAHQLMDYAQKMVNFIEREDFIKKVSSKLDISKETLIEEMDSIPQDFLSEVKESETHSEKIETADLLVGLILAFPKIAAEISELKNLKIESEIWQKLKTADFREISEVGEVGEKLAVLVSDKYSDFGDAKIKTEILKLIGKLNSELVEIKKRELKIAMQKAEEAGDEKKAAELFEKYQKLLAK
ncbi:hypothetical protein KAI54_03300, partial [Candidatus Gracilibacteria bacterium]|nr:hypothetical protein [Candidatus Gracilibacteria bacterium]